MQPKPLGGRHSSLDPDDSPTAVPHDNGHSGFVVYLDYLSGAPSPLHEHFPQAIGHRFHKEHVDRMPGRSFSADHACRTDPGIVHHEEIARAEKVDEIGNPVVFDRSIDWVQDKELGLLARERGFHRDKRVIKGKVKL
jgi:hypothetical protein